MNIRSTITRSLPLARVLPAALCSTLLLSTGAQAAEGFYVLGSVGQSRFDDDAISKSDKDFIFDNTVGIDSNSSSQDDKDTGYKMQLGYQFSENFAVEGGYTDLGEEVYTARYDDGITGKMKTSAKGWNVDAVLILPIDSGFSFFAKLGAIAAEVEQKISFEADGAYGSETLDDTKVKAKAGLGIAYNIVQGLSARAEYEHYAKLGDEDETGEINADVFSLGLSYQF